MPRRARLALPNVPLHIIQRGNNRQACFYDDEDYRLYLAWLHEHAERSGCQIHAYVLMTNHVHLLVSAMDAEAAGTLMKAQGQRYAQYVNRTYHRTGSLWEGRYRSCLVQDEGYLLACQRYIELNPVRAGMVVQPAEYRWSSYHANAQGEMNVLLKPHAVYEALGTDTLNRAAAYRDLFRGGVDLQMLGEIRRATNGNYVLGDKWFAEQIATALGRRVLPGQAGRPRKVEKHESMG